MTEIHTIRSYWEYLSDHEPTRLLLKIAGASNQGIIQYRVRTFYPKVQKLAAVLLRNFGLKEGSSIGVIADCSENMLLLLHAAWLLKVKVVIPEYIDRHLAENAFDQSKIKALFIDHDHRILGKELAIKFNLIESYFYIDSEVSAGAHSLASLYDLPSDLKALTSIVDEDFDALEIFKKESDQRLSSYCFTAQSLCLQAASWLHHFPVDFEDSEVAMMSNDAGAFEKILLTAICPMFTGFPFLIDGDFEVKRFWEHVKSDQIRWMFVTARDLEAVVRRGIQTLWEKPANLCIFVETSGAISKFLVRDFYSKFEIYVRPLLSSLEVGGFISIYPEDIGAEADQAWLLNQEVASLGIVLQHVRFRFVDESGIECSQGVRGSLEVLKNTNEWIKSGLDGYYLEDSKDRAHMMMCGPSSMGIFRSGEYINLFSINALILRLPGVLSGAAVPFSNNHVGVEIGIVLVIDHLSDKSLHDHEYLEYFKSELSGANAPKVVKRVKEGTDYHNLHDLDEMAKLFKDYRNIKFT